MGLKVADRPVAVDPKGRGSLPGGSLLKQKSNGTLRRQVLANNTAQKAGNPSSISGPTKRQTGEKSQGSGGARSQQPSQPFRFPGISLEKQKEIEQRGLDLLKQAEKAEKQQESKGPNDKPSWSTLPNLDLLYMFGGPEFDCMKHSKDYEGMTQALTKIMSQDKFIKAVQKNNYGDVKNQGAADNMTPAQWADVLGTQIAKAPAPARSHSSQQGKSMSRGNGPKNVPNPTKGQMVQPGKPVNKANGANQPMGNGQNGKKPQAGQQRQFPNSQNLPPNTAAKKQAQVGGPTRNPLSQKN